MIPPSDRVPERGLDWFSWIQRPCGGGTSDLGQTRWVSEYLGIYSAKRGAGGHRGGHNPPAHFSSTETLGSLYSYLCGLSIMNMNLFGVILVRTLG